jgi:hypothetical protein
MIKKSCLQIIAAIGLCFCPTVSESYVYKGRPNCPLYMKEHTWVDYLTGKYGDKNAAFSIRFDHLKAPIGSLAPNTCYTVVYEGGRWTTTGRDDTGRTTMPPNYGGADPGQKLMNIRGRIMKFNEFGQVFDQDMNLVGTLKCGLGPDC